MYSALNKLSEYIYWPYILLHMKKALLRTLLLLKLLKAFNVSSRSGYTHIIFAIMQITGEFLGIINTYHQRL